MKLISHRGNLDGIDPERENNPAYIDIAISSGFDVEVDIWVIDNRIYLGHNDPIYEIEFRWILSHIDNVWFHCKNVESAILLKSYGYDDIMFFSHSTDDFVLTSNGYFWTYPGKKLTKNSIAVLPETTNYTELDLEKCFGICSDNINNYIQHDK